MSKQLKALYYYSKHGTHKDVEISLKSQGVNVGIRWADLYHKDIDVDRADIVYLGQDVHPELRDKIITKYQDFPETEIYIWGDESSEPDTDHIRSQIEELDKNILEITELRDALKEQLNEIVNDESISSDPQPVEPEPESEPEPDVVDLEPKQTPTIEQVPESNSDDQQESEADDFLNIDSSSEDKKLDREELKEALKEAGVQFPKNATDAKLENLYLAHVTASDSN